MNTEQTNKAIGKSMISLIMVGIGLGLFGLVGAPILLWWQLGKLEPNSLRQLACGSICLLPIVTMASATYSFMLYKANRKGQDIGIGFARDSWSEVASGVFKVGQARQASRQPQPPAMVYPYPYELGPVSPQAGMIIEQRQVSDQMYD